VVNARADRRADREDEHRVDHWCPAVHWASITSSPIACHHE
jgi:hypothetical protein